MPVRVLGCSGSIAAGNRTTAFLIGQHVLIDAGTGVGDLTLDELTQVDHVLLTHAHLDHVLSLPLMADSVLRHRLNGGRGPVLVHALPETLEALQRHIFNDTIWPDFTRIPRPEHPILRYHPVHVGDHLDLGGHRVEVLPAAHTVPAVGYAVWKEPGTRAWVFTGDTGPNPALWQRLRHLDVAQLVIETAFRDSEQTIAQRSGHLHPAALAAELEHLRGDAQVYITHAKPGQLAGVMDEVSARHLPHPVSALAAGQLMPVG